VHYLETAVATVEVMNKEPTSSVTISAADLAMLDGVDLASVRRRKRYRRSA